MKPIPPLRTFVMNDNLLDVDLAIRSTSKVLPIPAQL